MFSVCLLYTLSFTRFFLGLSLKEHHYTLPDCPLIHKFDETGRREKLIVILPQRHQVVMKKLQVFLLILIVSGCSLSHPNKRTEKYYGALLGHTYRQISNPNILENGDTMLFKFVDSTHIETGFNHLLNDSGKLHNNTHYSLDCKRKPCSITMTHFYYDTDGTEQRDTSYKPDKGIIELLTDSTFKVRFITNSMDKRSFSFKPKNHPDIVTFKRKN